MDCTRTAGEKAMTSMAEVMLNVDEDGYIAVDGGLYSSYWRGGGADNGNQSRREGTSGAAIRQGILLEDVRGGQGAAGNYAAAGFRSSLYFDVDRRGAGFDAAIDAAMDAAIIVANEGNRAVESKVTRAPENLHCNRQQRIEQNRPTVLESNCAYESFSPRRREMTSRDEMQDSVNRGYGINIPLSPGIQAPPHPPPFPLQGFSPERRRIWSHGCCAVGQQPVVTADNMLDYEAASHTGQNTGAVYWSPATRRFVEKVNGSSSEALVPRRRQAWNGPPGETYLATSATRLHICLITSLVAFLCLLVLLVVGFVLWGWIQAYRLLDLTFPDDDVGDVPSSKLIIKDEYMLARTHVGGGNEVGNYTDPIY